MTLGKDLLKELGRLGKRYSYFTYEQHRQLRRIDSKDDLRAFLNENGFQEVGIDGDTKTIARNLVPFLEPQASGSKWVCALEVFCSTPLGWPFLPFLLLFVAIDAAGKGRLQFSIADILAFTALFAVCLSYELSIVPMIVDFEDRLWASSFLAAVSGSILFGIFRRPVWILISVNLVLLFEIAAFVV